jgi:hypothetical protein
MDDLLPKLITTIAESLMGKEGAVRVTTTPNKFTYAWVYKLGL